TSPPLSRPTYEGGERFPSGAMEPSRGFRVVWAEASNDLATRKETLHALRESTSLLRLPSDVRAQGHARPAAHGRRSLLLGGPSQVRVRQPRRRSVHQAGDADARAARA